MTHGTLETWNQFYARRRQESGLTAKQAGAEWRALKTLPSQIGVEKPYGIAENAPLHAVTITKPYNKPYVPNMIKLSW